ncbi:MAG: PIN domain-containing protein [Chloroflexi bacterium]|nr:PIN domain-containing protein [Chloroflexota bacterium]
MARLILDTSVLVAFERATQRLETLSDGEHDVALAAITIAELCLGIHLGGQDRRARREAFVDEILATFSIEPYEVDVAREHAILLAHTRRSGRPRGVHDLIIAATARARDRAVVTLDVAGFEGLPGVEVRAI